MRSKKVFLSSSITIEANEFLKWLENGVDWPLKKSWMIEKAIWALADKEGYDGPRPHVDKPHQTAAYLKVI